MTLARAKATSVDETIISHYSKKIFGFALSRTGHHHNAEDLAQEILVSLVRSLRSGKTIENMDAWVHKICCYTWTNYIAKEKRHWRNADVDAFELHDGSKPIESGLEALESAGQLRREIAYLSRLHRDILVRYYYEGKSVGDIAELLRLPQGTVKWHLFEARQKMREGMNRMETVQDLSYRPVKLVVGHSGSPGTNGEPNCYFNSLLANNIFVAAYEQPLTIEEIARKLGVASAFLEDYIAQFENAELMTNTGKGKYQTNFVIDNMSNRVRERAYMKQKAEELADDFYACIASRMDDIRKIGFHGCDATDHFLMWTLFLYALWHQYNTAKPWDYYAPYQPDERKDGGKYIVMARIHYTDEQYAEQMADYEIVRKYDCNGIKSRGDDKHRGVQMETWWSGMKWREFDCTDVIEMKRILDLIESGAEHNEHDKILISKMVEKGFVSHRDGKLTCLIPFFKPDQHKRFFDIVDEAFLEVGAKRKLEQVHDDFQSMWQEMAPSFVPKKDVVYKGLQHGMSIIFAIMEYLERTGKIQLPAEEEKARLTTIMWLNE